MATPYDSLIQQAAQQYVIDPDLIRAFISVESNGNPNATRQEPQIHDASYGLMQVLLSTARRLSGNSTLTSAQLKNPATNIAIGTSYVRELLDRYSGDLGAAIAAYNAGSATQILPGIFTNQGYVDKVMRAYSWQKMGYASILGVLVIAGLAYWAYTRKQAGKPMLPAALTKPVMIPATA